MAKNSRGFVEGHDEKIGKGEHANMPKDVVMKDYSRSAGMREGELDDTMTGIDRCLDNSESKRRRYMSNQK